MGCNKKMTAVIMIALLLQFRVKNNIGPVTTNNSKTSPAGKKAAFNVAKPTNNIKRQRKR